jgi:hypothetical protein
MGQAAAAPLSHLHGLLPLVESETLVWACSPNSTLEPGLKPFVDVSQIAGGRQPSLVPVGITNSYKRAGFQCLFPAMIDVSF